MRRVQIRFAAAMAGLLVAMMAALTVHAGEVRTGLQFQSRALAKAFTYSLYLPDAYAAEPGRRFPVVYLLHGYGGNDRQWIEGGKADETLDRLIGEGAIPPVIAVMPDASNSWYVD